MNLSICLCMHHDTLCFGSPITPQLMLPAYTSLSQQDFTIAIVDLMRSMLLIPNHGTRPSFTEAKFDGQNLSTLLVSWKDWGKVSTACLRHLTSSHDTYSRCLAPSPSFLLAASPRIHGAYLHPTILLADISRMVVSTYPSFMESTSHNWKRVVQGENVNMASENGWGDIF